MELNIDGQGTFYDIDHLSEAIRLSAKSSSHKYTTQKYALHWLTNSAKLSQEIEDHTYKTDKGSEFIINERGKIRYIHGNTPRDKAARRSFSDNVLTPDLQPYIARKNCASQTGKGIDDQRKQFERDVHRFYMENGCSNEGYILLTDASKFYDNIRHQDLKDMVEPHLKTEDECWFFDQCVDNFQRNVSWMTDEEYYQAVHHKYNSMDGFGKKVDPNDTSKILHKSVDIGDQTSQNAGIFYPHKVDDYITKVRGNKYSGRYMDDGYVIHRSKQYLQQLLVDIKAEYAKYGIYLNDKKTKIVKLSHKFIFLQRQYFLKSNGVLVQQINPTRVTKMRQKLKRLSVKYSNGERTYKQMHDMFYSWMEAHKLYMSKMQIDNLDSLFNTLFIPKEDINGQQELYDNSCRWNSAQEFDTEWQQLFFE